VTDLEPPPVPALPLGPNADAAGGGDLLDAGWQWCVRNRHWYRIPNGTVLATMDRCVGCGQPAPPPIPSPYAARSKHG
jgi:hypothetical protein